MNNGWNVALFAVLLAALCITTRIASAQASGVGTSKRGQMADALREQKLAGAKAAG